jgi:hypothetical protein
VELFHIGEQQAYSDYIVLKLSSGHFESCGVLGADGQLQLRFARDSTVARLWLQRVPRMARLQTPASTWERTKSGRDWGCRLDPQPCPPRFPRRLLLLLPCRRPSALSPAYGPARS